MIILFKYCADRENCESFRNFGFIYIYIYNNNASVVFPLLNGLISFVFKFRVISTERGRLLIKSMIQIR